MKIFNKNTVFVALSGMILTSCISDFQEVNTNPHRATDEQASREGLSSGAYFNALMQRPIPTGTGTGPANDYQVVQNMTTDNWVGYFSPGRNHWDRGTNQTSYYISDHRANGTFNTLIIGIMNPYFQIKEATHKVEAKDGNLIFTPKDIQNQAVYSIAVIVKVMGMHRATDLFGPIPYSAMGAGKTRVKYDSQEEVYRKFLEELEQAVATLTRFGADKTVLTDFDPVYQGNVSKWIRLGNSLMLRLAMRVRYANEELAKEYINKAVTNIGGLITDDEQAAKLTTSGRFVFHHSLVTMLGYGELKMGATIYSYLKGYEDPRADKYFTKTTAGGASDFYAVRSGIDPNTGADVYKDFSVPKVITTTPTYWLRASEVQFLLAEAALAGYTSGTAESYYNKGVETSFIENGLSAAEATAYLTDSKKPATYNDPKNPAYNAVAVSTIAKGWNSVSSDEEHLEQIITQKYLANYPNGFESWSEWRRTGYPRMFKVPVNLSNKGAVDITDDGKDRGMRRFPFPEEEFRLNNENVIAAKSLLGGADNAATNVWWDKKTK